MASKDSKPSSICPECKTPQFGQSPFCEHCGFRLRSQETALEGVPAITPSQLQSVSRGRASTQEEPSITADQVKQQSPSQTFVEGLPPVKRQPRQPQPTPAPPSGEYSQPAIAPAEISALMPMAPPPPNKLAWLIPLITGLMCGGILGTAFTWIGTKNSNSKAQEHLLPASPPNERIAFAQTSFTQGLDEPTRARILRLCYKLSEDADKECEQDTLLKDEYPQESVTVAPFHIDTNEATNAEYNACISAGSCDEIDLKTCQVYTTQGLQISLRVPKVLLQDEHPVVCLSHPQAQKFCAWKQGRLPTHQEWELAARGSKDSRIFPWGDSWNPDHANWGEKDITSTSVAGKLDGFDWTAPPGLFHKGDSPFSLRDMAGNVAEWVATDEAHSTPQARGGGWTSTPYDLRTTKRLTLTQHIGRTDVGVRCAFNP